MLIIIALYAKNGRHATKTSCEAYNRVLQRSIQKQIPGAVSYSGTNYSSSGYLTTSIIGRTVYHPINRSKDTPIISNAASFDLYVYYRRGYTAAVLVDQTLWPAPRKPPRKK